MIDEFGYKTKSKDSEKSLAGLSGIGHSIIVHKLHLLELPEKIVTWVTQSSLNCDLSNKNEAEIVSQVTNLTETHCRYIYQLCNRAEIDKLFESVYDDFKNEGALHLWEQCKQEEIEYNAQSVSKTG